MSKTNEVNNPHPVTAIEIKNLWYQYSESIALEGINLKVPELDYLGIIGPNGGGKTTLLKCIVGIIGDYQGEIKVFGVSNGKKHQSIGYVPQHSTFVEDFPASVEEVVMMGTLGKKHIMGWLKKRDKERAHEVLETVGLADMHNRHIGNLSGGERQRLLIARALISNPKILLLDEPAASLDTNFGQGLYEILQELNETMTIIMVSHDIGVISRHVKTIACINKRLFTEGTKEITEKMLGEAYKCPVDLIAHGIPHRVFPVHNHSVYHDPEN